MEQKNIKKCDWCHKEIITDSDGFKDNLGNKFCSKICQDKFYMARDMETYETDEVRCPYCNEIQGDIFEGGYYEADDDEFECDFCEKTFKLSAYTTTSFTAYPTEQEIEKIYKERDDIDG